MKSKNQIVGVLGGVALLAAAACCQTTGYPQQPRGEGVRATSSVGIDSLCVPFTDDGMIGMPSGLLGTGVVISPRHVLTADHVVACAVLPDVHVTLVNGQRWRVDVVREWPEEDTALLEIHAAGTFGIASAVPFIAEPVIGERVCSSVVQPMRAEHCGIVLDRGAYWFGTNAQSLPGNSGAPVYNDWGALLGVTHGQFRIAPNHTIVLNGRVRDAFAIANPAVVEGGR